MDEVVDGTLQGRLDEVVLQSSGGVLLQGLVGHVVGVGVDQAPQRETSIPPQGEEVPRLIAGVVRLPESRVVGYYVGPG